MKEKPFESKCQSAASISYNKHAFSGSMEARESPASWQVSSRARMELFKQGWPERYHNPLLLLTNCTGGYESGEKVRHVLNAPSYSGVQGHELP